jgi:hypothetical protein
MMNDLEEKLTTHDHRASGSGALKTNRGSVHHTVVDEIGKRSTMAAKAKFVRENKRSEVLDGLQIIAMQCNWFDVTKQRICAESTRRNWRIWISGKSNV